MNDIPDQPLTQINPVNPDAPSGQKSESHLRLIIIILTVLLVVSVSILSFVIIRSPRQEVTTVAPSPTPPGAGLTPTPIRKLSSFATDSAFINFEASVATLSAVTAGYPIFDSSLNPPKLDLPLGFR